jgi:hypothetical protein
MYSLPGHDDALEGIAVDWRLVDVWFEKDLEALA